jgi:hypothetical protein
VAKGVPIHKLTQPDAPLRESAPVILVRLQEMYDFAPAIRDPANVEELHNMRIAAKRLRYTMELFAPVFGQEFAQTLKVVEDIQERLGAIHDADVIVPLLEDAQEKETERERKKALKKNSGGPPQFVAAEGLAPLTARRRADRDRLYHEFVAFWDALPPDAFFERVGQALQPDAADAEDSAPVAAEDASAAGAAQEPPPPDAEDDVHAAALAPPGEAIEDHEVEPAPPPSA